MVDGGGGLSVDGSGFSLDGGGLSGDGGVIRMWWRGWWMVA